MPVKGEDSKIYISKSLQPADDSESPHVDTVCATLLDVQALAKRFEGSQHDGERLLHSRLVDDILPAFQGRPAKYQEQIQIEADAAADLGGRQVVQPFSKRRPF